jgi:hypothetical protein
VIPTDFKRELNGVAARVAGRFATARTLDGHFARVPGASAPKPQVFDFNIEIRHGWAPPEPRIGADICPAKFA